MSDVNLRGSLLNSDYIADTIQPSDERKSPATTTGTFGKFGKKITAGTASQLYKAATTIAQIPTGRAAAQYLSEAARRAVNTAVEKANVADAVSPGARVKQVFSLHKKRDVESEINFESTLKPLLGDSELKDAGIIKNFESLVSDRENIPLQEPSNYSPPPYMPPKANK